MYQNRLLSRQASKMKKDILPGVFISKTNLNGLLIPKP